jgi:hypothetical protein
MGTVHHRRFLIPELFEYFDHSGSIDRVKHRSRNWGSLAESRFGKPRVTGKNSPYHH